MLTFNFTGTVILYVDMFHLSKQLSSTVVSWNPRGHTHIAISSQCVLQTGSCVAETGMKRQDVMAGCAHG